ncbi:pyridoxal phosphate-dependent aminotransferase [Marinicella rhabdoformis]|uniref:pyridoxal phosphate-dependent aminotransferase n=1 Tax=Marinicella rhabdoformis TaxID=2580566 RepID=UPI0012AED612|nr:pyridoxal phosphate-dependent aminotransferase [Marinicella rhabdoformis]
MEKNFKNLTMMSWSDRWPNAMPLSNSNPEPFTAAELSELTGQDWLALPLNDLDYQTAQGDPNLRSDMAQQWYPKCQPNDVMLCAGAQEALFIAFQTLVKSGEHVVCFTPAFEPLILMPEQIGARVTKLPLGSNWEIDFNALEDALKDHAKLLVLNFPHNPTGAHISIEILEEIIQLCEKYGVWVLSDEVFRGLEHNKNDRLPAVANIYPQAVSLGVMSKAFALPAIRLGWLVCQDKNTYQQMLEIKNHLSICVSGLDVAFMKKMVPFDELIWQRSVDLTNQNKKLLQKALINHPTFHCQMGTASATCFIGCQNDQIWTASLAQNHQLKLLPGFCFATEKQGFRLSLGQKNFKQTMDTWLNYSV